jgi:hypothetical protein
MEDGVQLVSGGTIRELIGGRSYMGSVKGPRLTDCQELHQISQIRLDSDLSQISPKPVSHLTD